MDNNMKYCIQIAYLNQLINKKLITEVEYKKIKNYIKDKYGVRASGNGRMKVRHFAAIKYRSST